MSWYSEQPFHVYVITAGDHQKVGSTAAIETRIAHLQTANFAELTIAKAVQFPDRQAAAYVEKYAQALLVLHHVRGEWFCVDLQTALAALDEAVVAVAAGRRAAFAARRTDGANKVPVVVRARMTA